MEFSDAGLPIGMDLNLWPYSNCKDRSFKYTDSKTFSMIDFFEAKIVNPKVIPQKGTDLKIQIEKGKTSSEDKMYL